MKKIIITLFLLLICYINVTSSTHDRDYNTVTDSLETILCERENEINIDLMYKHQSSVYLDSLVSWGIDFNLYESRLSVRESSGVLDTVNTVGSLGLYQFRESTLLSLHNQGYINNHSIDKFLTSKIYQRQALIALTYHNFKIAKRLRLLSYENKNIQGILISSEGILAAMHLKGPRGVLRYLKSNGIRNESDAYNTHVSEYIRLMS